jgi:hypothetical protein
MTELNNEYEELMQRGNDIFETEDIEIDYNTEDRKERYDIVHAVIDKVMLRRDDKVLLYITVYNKVDRNIIELKYNSFKKKFE